MEEITQLGAQWRYLADLLVLNEKTKIPQIAQSGSWQTNACTSQLHQSEWNFRRGTSPQGWKETRCS